MPRLRAETVETIQERVEVVALDLFIRKGYSGTPTREIAKAAGFTAGALYSHYPSKEALFRAVVERYRLQFADEAVDNPLRSLFRNSRFPDDIPALARAIKALVQGNRAYWMLWYIDVLEFQGKHFHSQLAPQALLGEPHLRRHLNRLRDEQALRIDPEVAFVMVYMHLFNFYLVETIFGGRSHYGVSEAKAIEAIAQVFERGLRVERA